VVASERSARTSGVLLVAKEPGVTSHDVVERIRRGSLAAGTKVGHAGTLDPFATGLLVVLVGQGTRLQRFFTALPKAYRAVVRFGFVSDTGDPTGELEPTGRTTDEEAVRRALPALVGSIEQRVPLTSAVKVGGERLYRRARRRESFETPLRTVQVTRLDLVGFDAALQAGELEVECSSGTYVRRLVADLGELCGAGAYCAELVRTRVGPFALESASEERLLPLSEALSFLAERVLSADEEQVVRNGVAVPAAGVPPGETTVRLTAGGELVAVAERRGRDLKPVTVISGS
jgi:tRNA pseudouridine55 synthase